MTTDTVHADEMDALGDAVEQAVVDHLGVDRADVKVTVETVPLPASDADQVTLSARWIE